MQKQDALMDLPVVTLQEPKVERRRGWEVERTQTGV